MCTKTPCRGFCRVAHAAHSWRVRLWLAKNPSKGFVRQERHPPPTHPQKSPKDLCGGMQRALDCRGSAATAESGIIRQNSSWLSQIQHRQLKLGFLMWEVRETVGDRWVATDQAAQRYPDIRKNWPNKKKTSPPRGPQACFLHSMETLYSSVHPDQTKIPS